MSALTVDESVLISPNLKTTSLIVAEKFGKRHDDVLRRIRNVLIDTEEWGLPNFAETPYIEPQNGQTYPMYEITRDGFVLLVMGFTGKRAMEWKIKFLSAFNQMEAALADKAPKLTARQRQNKIAYWQSVAYQAEQQLQSLGVDGGQSQRVTRDELASLLQTTISSVLHQIPASATVGLTNTQCRLIQVKIIDNWDRQKDRRKVFDLLKDHFDVSRYRDIPSGDFNEAMEFIDRQFEGAAI